MKGKKERRKKELPPLTRALFNAIEAGSDGVGMVKEYIKVMENKGDLRASLRVKNERGDTPLSLAIDKKQIKIVRLLLSYDPTLANEAIKPNDVNEVLPLKQVNFVTVYDQIERERERTLAALSTAEKRSEFFPYGDILGTRESKNAANEKEMSPCLKIKALLEAAADRAVYAVGTN